MNIAEVYRSIQGESSLAGVPTFFIRCAGCNLNCIWCDTPYARFGGEKRNIDVLVDDAISSGLSTVCITGGEPLLQPDVSLLADKLLDHGFTVCVETNGTQPVSVLSNDIKAVIDVKCPGSGEEGAFHLDNLSRRRKLDEFKFVLSDRNDFEFALEFVKFHSLDESNTILLSPLLSSLSPVLLAEWIISEFPTARLNLQLHRVIWPDDVRGR